MNKGVEVVPAHAGVCRTNRSSGSPWSDLSPLTRARGAASSAAPGGEQAAIPVASGGARRSGGAHSPRGRSRRLAIAYGPEREAAAACLGRQFKWQGAPTESEMSVHPQPRCLEATRRRLGGRLQRSVVREAARWSCCSPVSGVSTPSPFLLRRPLPMRHPRAWPCCLGQGETPSSPNSRKSRLRRLGISRLRP